MNTGTSGRFLSRKSTKVLANGLKPVFVLDYWLRPKKRYTLPSFSPPRKRVDSGPIPFRIWQTNYTDKVTLSIYTNYLFNRRLTPEFEYNYVSDEQCDSFVKESYPSEIYSAFSRLQIGAARADFWRILVLAKHGGIYLDIDSNFVRPPSGYLDGERTEVFVRNRKGNITNYFIASAPGNPILLQLISRILKNIKESNATTVNHLTGPKVVDLVVRKHPNAYVADGREICTQGQFTNKMLQYVDKKGGIWTEEQKVKSILR
jgi:mannosyltransferase OCH1-like enzyme